MSENEVKGSEILKELEANYDEVDEYVQASLQVIDDIENPMICNLAACMVSAIVYQRFPGLVEFLSKVLEEGDTDE